MVSGVAYIIFLYVSNVFLARYDSGRFLSHLTDGGYGFNAVGSPGINMYQMYVVSPTVKEVCITSGLAQSTNHMAYLLEMLKKCATFLRSFFNRCESEIDVAPVKCTSFERGGGWDPSVAQCCLGSV